MGLLVVTTPPAWMAPRSPMMYLQATGDQHTNPQTDKHTLFLSSILDVVGHVDGQDVALLEPLPLEGLGSRVDPLPELLEGDAGARVGVEGRSALLHLGVGPAGAHKVHEGARGDGEVLERRAEDGHGAKLRARRDRDRGGTSHTVIRTEGTRDRRKALREGEEERHGNSCAEERALCQ